MRAPYRSAQRITTTARNVLVRFELSDGTVGYGESAPATYVTGETQASVLERIEAMVPRLVSAPLLPVYQTIFGMKEPGAHGAMEMAFFDACGKSAGQSLYGQMRQKRKVLVPINQQTDLSLPLLPPTEAENRALEAARDGFRAIKIKIGGPDVDEDEARVRAIARAAPEAILRLDGNQGFAPEDAVRFMERLIDLLPRIELLEQPTKAGDDDALLFVQSRVSVPVFADEAIHHSDDAKRLLDMGACKGVVLKLAKSGVMQTLHIAAVTEAAGGQLMFGCMMETRLAVSTALQLAAAIAPENSSLRHPYWPEEHALNTPARTGRGTPVLLDLDGHLLTKADGMVSGGFTQEGDVLTFDPQTPGLGVDVVWPPE